MKFKFLFFSAILNGAGCSHVQHVGMDCDGESKYSRQVGKIDTIPKVSLQVAEFHTDNPMNSSQ